MNTKKEVLDKVIGNKYARCIQKPFTDEYFFPEKAVYNAMKEYSDQQIEEYKKKLKGTLMVQSCHSMKITDIVLLIEKLTTV